jgi:hypothetical protein
MTICFGPGGCRITIYAATGPAAMPWLGRFVLAAVREPVAAFAMRQPGSPIGNQMLINDYFELLRAIFVPDAE